MKRFTIFALVSLISISVLFRGLFFDVDTFAFLSAIALLSVAYLLIKLKNNEAIYFDKWLSVSGLLLLAAYSFSFINAANTREDLITFLKYVGYFMSFIVIYDYFRDKKRHFALATMVSAVTAGFICAVIGMEAMTGLFNDLTKPTGNDRLNSTFQYPNTAAIYFVVCIVFVLVLINITDKMIVKAVLVGIGNTVAFALFMTGSRGGYLIGVITLIIFLTLQPQGFKTNGVGSLVCMILPIFLSTRGFSTAISTKNHYLAAIWMVLAFLAALILFLIFSWFKKSVFISKYKMMAYVSTGILLAAVLTFLIIFYRERLIGVIPHNIVIRLKNYLNFTDISYVNRIAYYRDALKLISKNWLFGLGGGGWVSLYQSVQTYFYTAREVHNNYLQIFVEAGILGFTSYISMIIISLVNTIKSVFRAKDTSTRIFSSAILCAFLALAVHSSFDFDMAFSSIALLLWTVMAGSAIFLSDKEADVSLNAVRIREFSGNAAVKVILIAACSFMISICGLYTASSYNGEKGYYYVDEGDYKEALVFYQEAYRLDPINADYIAELAKLYNYYADNNTNPEYAKQWRTEAVAAAQKAVSLDGYNPDYIDILALTYTKSDMPLKALDQLEKLVQYQPCKSGNYEELAKGYINAADYYIKTGEKEKAGDMLKKCTELANAKYAAKTSELEVCLNEAANDWNAISRN